MEIKPEDLVEFTQDPETTVNVSHEDGHTAWRVDWHQQGQRMSVGLRVTDLYAKQVKYGAVTPLLELRRLIAGEVDGTNEPSTYLPATRLKNPNPW